MMSEERQRGQNWFHRWTGGGGWQWGGGVANRQHTENLAQRAKLGFKSRQSLKFFLPFVNECGVTDIYLRGGIM